MYFLKEINNMIRLNDLYVIKLKNNNENKKNLLILYNKIFFIKEIFYSKKDFYFRINKIKEKEKKKEKTLLIYKCLKHRNMFIKIFRKLKLKEGSRALSNKILIIACVNSYIDNQKNMTKVKQWFYKKHIDKR